MKSYKSGISQFREIGYEARHTRQFLGNYDHLPTNKGLTENYAAPMLVPKEAQLTTCE